MQCACGGVHANRLPTHIQYAVRMRMHCVACNPCEMLMHCVA